MRKILSRAKRFDVTRPLSPRLEITSFLANWTRARGDYPTFVFRTVVGYPDATIVMNLWDRNGLDSRLGLPKPGGQTALSERLSHPARGDLTSATPLFQTMSSLSELPILTHQPREPAPYLTSFIGCIHDPRNDTRNIGFYRGQVLDARSVAVFMDPRTDAYGIWAARLKTEREMPFAMFAGGDIRTALIAASGLGGELDSFEAAARLTDAPLALCFYEDLQFAADAEVVLTGTLTAATTNEGPFGEFKGYYSGTTSSPIFHVEKILTAPDYVFPGLFCGRQDGLTLMAYSNEMLMAQHLEAQGYEVNGVLYDLSAFGEYRVEITTRDLTQYGLLQSAMDFDARAKVFFVTDGHNRVEKTLAYSPLDVIVEPYMRYGRPEGARIGVLARDVQGKYDWSEY